MADFNSAIPAILRNEGGYSNVTGDSGGETYRGISRNNFPSWRGWEYVDTAKPLHDEEIIHNDLLEALVKDFYRKNFWDENQLDKIQNQEIACKVFDMCVNMGSSRGIKILQQALVNDFRHPINIDGRIGPETIRVTNQEAGSVLLQKIRNRCKEFYTELAERKPVLHKFLNGWLRRAEQ